MDAKAARRRLKGRGRFKSHGSQRLFWLYRRVTAMWRPLPHFVVIGAQRCGTSWTYRRLTAHPPILPAWRKEIHFFDLDDAYALGPPWYRAHFPRTPRGAITGEATPAYLFVPEALPRLAALLPKARLVVLLRDPVDRAYSQFQLGRRRRGDDRTFESVLEGQEHRARSGLGSAGFLLRGHYADQLVRLFEFYPREQVLILRSEDLFAQPVAVLGQLFAFIGVPAPTVLDLAPDRTFPYEKMRADTRARLVEYYRPHNQRL